MQPNAGSLYTKAADLLGSDKAPVRLSGNLARALGQLRRHAPGVRMSWSW
ncbi:hypothetical protein [Amycolatopsis sp. cmx-11-12]